MEGGQDEPGKESERESRGAKKDIFRTAKRGCCDDMTVIQTDICSRDETTSEQA